MRAHLKPDSRADLQKEHEETTPAKVLHHIGKGVFYKRKRREESAKMPPRTGQERARSNPKRPQNVPRAPQERPRAPRDHPRAPRCAQERPKSGPRVATSAPRAPKSAPRAPKTCPGAAPRAPQTCKKLQKTNENTKGTSSSAFYRKIYGNGWVIQRREGKRFPFLWNWKIRD